MKSVQKADYSKMIKNSERLQLKKGEFLNSLIVLNKY